MTAVKICIDVADLDEAGAFYCQALECIEVGRNPRTVRLTAGGTELYLMLRPEGSMPFPAATEGRSAPLSPGTSGKQATRRECCVP